MNKNQAYFLLAHIYIFGSFALSLFYPWALWLLVGPFILIVLGIFIAGFVIQYRKLGE